ncbi:hypothetical protein OIU85_013042 [Salix viminalis]|uniref:Pentatricopeptide repeat-containing protein n=1 Tax=Salix viminalis TaxID=40686 RepID=A0A9Q0NQQ6_SALVM|nr:hypothetical protein OIU85_013042 [Salix viminalis]
MHAQGSSPDLITYSILLDGISKQGYIDQALELFREMQNSHLKPNLMIYNILIDAMCKSGKLEDARGLFSELYVKGLLPNVQVWTTIICGLCREGLLDEACKALRQMERDGCPPDGWCYNVIVRGFLRNNDASQAKQLLQEMFDRGFSADAHTRNFMGDLLSNDGMAILIVSFVCGIGLHVFLFVEYMMIEIMCTRGYTITINDSFSKLFTIIMFDAKGRRQQTLAWVIVLTRLFQAGKLTSIRTRLKWRLLFLHCSDIVEMASHAPLLMNCNDRRWTPDAIAFNLLKHCEFEWRNLPKLKV